MRLNRRQLIATGVMGGVALVATSATTRAQQVEETPVPASTLAPTSPPDIAQFNGPLADVWDAPWNTEGLLIPFNGVILYRAVAPEGEAFLTGSESLPYRSHILIEVQVEGYGARNLMVATNDDLSAVESRHTAHVIGTYGGKHSYLDPSVSGVWDVPLIIADNVEPAIAATPTADDEDCDADV